jgi:hypothetical protein
MLVRWAWLLLGSATLLSASPPGRIRRVPGDYRTLQEAIDSTSPGDTVLVAPGRYQENIRLYGSGSAVLLQ